MPAMTTQLTFRPKIRWGLSEILGFRHACHWEMSSKRCRLFRAVTLGNIGVVRKRIVVSSPPSGGRGRQSRWSGGILLAQVSLQAAQHLMLAQEFAVSPPAM